MDHASSSKMRPITASRERFNGKYQTRYAHPTGGPKTAYGKPSQVSGFHGSGHQRVGLRQTQKCQETY
jgi:ribosomal protein L32E